MSDIIYVKVIGEQQGFISEGCGSEASVGNRYQLGHEDEIFVFSLVAAVSSTPEGVNHHGIQFCKTIDKSSPLFIQAINSNEYCSLDFIFYRINQWGRWEKYYNIEVRGATVDGFHQHIDLEGLAAEYITIHYDYICSRHLIANTECCELLTPENYNKLFPVIPPVMEKKEELPKKREVTLTIGVFFDGTGNNLLNTNLRMATCNPEHYELDVRALTEFNQKCINKEIDFDGIEAGSYLNYYTNIKHLNKLYQNTLTNGTAGNIVQRKIYIEGIGTENKKADSLLGMALGNNDTGIIAKTNKAIFLIEDILKKFISEPNNKNIILKNIQFDVFGFSRGAAAARHFTNRVFEGDTELKNIIHTVCINMEYKGKPTGEVHFLGLFDTVTAVGGLDDGFDTHDSNNLTVKLALPSGVAKHVFHLTAMHECRYNFCLNSIKEHWPELSFPGAHADIGGGYNPFEDEYLFLTRPSMQTVPEDISEKSTKVYLNAAEEIKRLSTHPVLAPLLPSGILKIETDTHDIMKPNQYNNYKKRVAAAVTLRRMVNNDWSKIALRVMYEVAKEAGVIFDEIQNDDPDLQYSPEIENLCKKSIRQGKDVFFGKIPEYFSNFELNIIGNYIHCSANWNAIDYHIKHPITSAVSFSETISFVNRPDENWTRTVYNMSGVKIK